ncbi:hypothetical protein J0X19_07575 [Hymenobacter sp. BT186]|uniref:Lipoprotein n=1 Tax=Hymenobacter telluris TaxID=2816474 RepID=A0A939EVJ2_9BACT|nr:hypothetical protein [Hymenobacter telluris]MBO0357801.1 hypothetical protein [Hymenobacter telluris]MBW3373828.1 hypothetical protein [Hymenobacter norwichensis]
MAYSRTITGLVLVGALSGCMTTRVATSHDCDSVVNDPNNTQLVTAYFWGLKQPTDVRPACDPRFSHLNGVTVKTSFGNYLLALATVGIVTRQRVSWCCAPYTPPIDTLGLAPGAPGFPLSLSVRP